MKRFLTRLGRISKTVLGVMCGLCTLVYVVTAITEAEVRVMFTVLAIIFGLFTFLLLRKRKPKAKPVVSDLTQAAEPGISISFAEREVPADILRDMRKYYSPMQAQNDARILAESFQLCQQTYNDETFFSRLQLARRCAHTLLQAKQAGCKIDKRTIKACESALSAVDALMLDFLDRIFEKETTAAMQLKTQAGRQRRLEAFLNRLQEHDADFIPIESAYNEYLDKVRQLMEE